MTYLRSFITLSLFISPFVGADLLTRNIDGTYTPQKAKVDVVNFLSEVNDKTGINVRCDDTMESTIELPLIKLGRTQLLRVIDGQYSTIKGFDNNGQLNSLDVLPLGQYSASRNLVPVGQLREQRKLLREPSSGASPPNEVPGHIDISNVTTEEWGTLTTEEAHAVSRAINNKRQEENRKLGQEQRLQRDKKFADSIEQLKSKNPKLHAIMVERYAKRLERANTTDKSNY